MRLVCSCLLVVFACSLSIPAQENNSAQRGEISYDLWRVRSQTITEELIKDARNFTPSGRALLWARLAEQWWLDDPEKAHSWILKAIEIVEAVPNKENPSERNLRLSTTRWLLKIVAPLDQKLSARLAAILSDDAEHMGDLERGANAEGLIEAAISIVDKEPQRAAALGALALHIGQPTQIAWLISRLRTKDAKLADALFTEALVAAARTLDREFLNSLAYAAFPESMRGDVSIPAPPDNLRTELLKLEIVYLEANPINADNRTFICISVGSFIAPLLAQFDRLLPQQAAFARQSVNQCLPGNPLVRQRVDDDLRDQSLNTVDDLLKAADDAKDLKVRTVYQYRAASLAQEKKDYDLALKILDSIDKEGREFMSGSWEAYRWQWAATSALRHFTTGDVYGMRLVMNAVPADLQPFARMAFVSGLPANRDKETDPTLEFLNDARTGLRRASLSDAEKSDGYLGLLPLMLKYQPTEATAVLKEAIAALNHVAQAKDKNTDNNEGSSLSGAGFAKNLPASLLEMDEYAVKEAVASITSPAIRAQVRLELLGVCLQRMRSSKQVTPKPTQSTTRRA